MLSLGADRRIGGEIIGGGIVGILPVAATLQSDQCVCESTELHHPEQRGEAGGKAGIIEPSLFLVHHACT